MGKKSQTVIKELFHIAIILMCLAMIGMALFGRQGLLHLEEKKSEYEAIRHEIQRLEAENTALKARLEKLEKDPSTQEQEIRKKLMYAKKGETVYQITEPEGKK